MINNSHSNPKFYFSVQDSKEVYEFDNNHGFNDFIVLYMASNISVDEIKFTISKDDNAFVIKGEPKEKLHNANIPKKEVQKLFSMYDRAFAVSEFYYCNPAYNTFEEWGIHLEQFDKVQNEMNIILNIKKLNQLPIAITTIMESFMNIKK